MTSSRYRFVMCRKEDGRPIVCRSTLEEIDKLCAPLNPPGYTYEIRQLMDVGEYKYHFEGSKCRIETIRPERWEVVKQVTKFDNSDYTVGYFNENNSFVANPKYLK